MGQWNLSWGLFQLKTLQSDNFQKHFYEKLQASLGKGGQAGIGKDKDWRVAEHLLLAMLRNVSNVFGGCVSDRSARTEALRTSK